MKTALTIAGTDPSGGAGTAADIKTMTAHGVYGMAAVTALVAQNTTGVRAVQETPPDFLARQLDCVFTDIFPDAVKTGMLPSPALIRVTVEKLTEYRAKNIVVDPVMVATSGDRLVSEEAVRAIEEMLLPLACLLTPNIPEAEVLSGLAITDAAGMERAARAIGQRYGCAVLCKGGHQTQDANDLLWIEGRLQWIPGRRIETRNTHGTGCTLSSAIASNLAKGLPLPQAVVRAKEYLTGALAAMLQLGHGCGPVDHLFDLKGAFVG